MTKTVQNAPNDTSWLRFVHSKYFLIVCASVLALTTLLWAVLGAWLNMQNADQLVDGYLFKDSVTFREASFPAAHSFLLKWPLFIIAGHYSASSAALITLTAVCVLATIGGLAYILWRIERRPAVLGMLYLGLSSILLLTPYAPSPGVLLPVNMAMLTTRNIEYLLFIAAIIACIRASRLRSWYSALAVVLFALLFASDKLFVGIGLGGAVIMLVAYGVLRQAVLIKLAGRWLAVSLAGMAAANLVLWIINITELTTIVSSSYSGGPFGFTTNPVDVIQAAIYAVLNILGNFGANPGFDAKEFRLLPGRVIHHFLSVAGLPFLINLTLTIAAIYAAWRLLRSSVEAPGKSSATGLGSAHNQRSLPFQLAITLYSSLLAAVVLYSLTEHNYVADGRYVAIALFALAVGVAAYVVRHRVQATAVYNKRLVVIGAVLFTSVVLAGVANVGMYQDYKAALSKVVSRNAAVSRAITGHQTSTLVGDYWRVLPIKPTVNSNLTVVPLASCTDELSVLSSKAWRPDLSDRSFAYLLTYDGSLTNFPHCTLDQVTNTFGKPNASITIDGALNKPKEQLLFYDHGANKSDPKVTKPTQRQPATVVPIGLDEQPYTDCSARTVMNFVAHQDDDLLFMNPDLMEDINSGDCVRTVYLTAGDSGYDESYWLTRVRGAEQAYSKMTGDNSIWIQRIIRIAPGDYITIANPRGNHKVSLIFMKLPDGNLHGEGFASTGHQTLAGLWADRIPNMMAIDKSSTYTSADLINVLTKLMETYHPDEVNTQADYDYAPSSPYPDHSDHVATSHFVQRAYAAYLTAPPAGAAVAPPLTKYIGYPIRSLQPNVVGDGLQNKQSTFFTYGQYDLGTCKTSIECGRQAYGEYLQRQYHQQ